MVPIARSVEIIGRWLEAPVKPFGQPIANRLVLPMLLEATRIFEEARSATSATSIWPCCSASVFRPTRAGCSGGPMPWVRGEFSLCSAISTRPNSEIAQLRCWKGWRRPTGGFTRGDLRNRPKRSRAARLPSGGCRIYRRDRSLSKPGASSGCNDALVSPSFRAFLKVAFALALSPAKA